LNITIEKNRKIKVESFYTFENIGEVKDLDRYESYYETWDGKVLTESEIGNWKRIGGDYSKNKRKRANKAHVGDYIRRKQKDAYEEITKKVEEKPKSDDKAKADNKEKNSKIVEAEKAVSKKDKKQEKTESKKEPEKKGNDKKDTSSKGNEKKDDGKKEIPLYHTVKADQTIYAISREYNVPVNHLLKLNPTLKNGKVVTGQKIKLKEK